MTLTSENLPLSPESSGYIYALGSVKPYFPTLDLEKQYDAAVQIVNPRSATFADVFDYTVSPSGQSQLSYRPFLYLAEQAVWVFTIDGIDTYRLNPPTPTQLNALIQASDNTNSTYILLGKMLSEANFDTADIDPAGAGLSIVKLAHLVEQNVTQQGNESESILPPLKTNIGKSSVERAINYFLSNYQSINADENGHTIVKQQSGLEFDIANSDGGREIVEIILICPDRSRFASSIDVTNQYPFVSSPLSPFSKS